jgi:hypothetical protein
LAARISLEDELVGKVENILITGVQLQLSLLRRRGSSVLVEKVGMSNTGIVQ